MKIENIRKKIASIYKQQLGNDHKTFDFRTAIGDNQLLITDIDKAIDKYEGLVERHKLMGIDNPGVVGALNNLRMTSQTLAEQNKALQSKARNINDYNTQTDTLISDYQKAVSAYTKSKGKGFYDIGVQVNFSFEMHQNDFLRCLDIANKNGLDVQIMEQDGRTLPNRALSIMPDYKGSISFLIPSSQLAGLKDIIASESQSLLDFNNRYAPSFNSYFLMPHINEYEDASLDAMRVYLEDNYDSSNRIANAFCVSAIFRSQIMTATYPNYDDVKSAQKLAFDNIKVYENNDLKKNNRQHINGIMPSIYVYSNDQLINLGIDDLDLELSISVPREIDLYENINEKSLERTV